LIVHGGAGDVTEDRRERHVDGCKRAAERGEQILIQGGSALDAVEQAVSALEDDPVFNAGTGACLTLEGRLELDASIMDGSGLRAGGVAALGPFKNPIAIARAVLEDGVHALYAGPGADAFARQAGFSPVDPQTMITDASREKLERAIASGTITPWAGGTVGAVARDSAGRVAAATSTGGMVGKRPGRVGDSPLVGAGTFADERGGAASATGHGEGILRVTLTASAVRAIERGIDPEQAAREAIDTLFDRVGSTGGIILVSTAGRVAFARSTRSMSWAARWAGGNDAGA
jgi:beta-aspartyl-peptidase (threonine type)